MKYTYLLSQSMKYTTILIEISAFITVLNPYKNNSNIYDMMI